MMSGLGTEGLILRILLMAVIALNCPLLLGIKINFSFQVRTISIR